MKCVNERCSERSSRQQPRSWAGLAIFASSAFQCGRYITRGSPNQVGDSFSRCRFVYIVTMKQQIKRRGLGMVTCTLELQAIAQDCRIRWLRYVFLLRCNDKALFASVASFYRSYCSFFRHAEFFVALSIDFCLTCDVTHNAKSSRIRFRGTTKKKGSSVIKVNCCRCEDAKLFFV